LDFCFRWREAIGNVSYLEYKKAPIVPPRSGLFAATERLTAALDLLGHPVLVNDDGLTVTMAIADGDVLTADMTNANVAVAVVMLTDADTVRADADPHVVCESRDSHGNPDSSEHSQSKRTHRSLLVLCALENE
jgi:hypothetical protein